MATPLFQHKNILVTGGAGFIGSHLCERLLEDGHRVICIDNFSTGDVSNINALMQNDSFRFIRADVNEAFDLESYPELTPFKIPFQGIQEIYHLACPTAIKKFNDFKVQTLLSNSTGNYHVLELARKYRSRILLTSSSVVYGGRQSKEPKVQEEEIGTVNQLSPRACYDEGKRFAETMFQTYQDVHGLETRIARVFRTYGPRMPLFDGHLIPDFVLDALDGKDLVLYGGKDFHTSLCYVTDVIDGLVRLMNTPTDPGPVNLGSDVDLSLETVAKLIVTMTESTSNLVPGDDLLFLSELALPHIEKMKNLGWFPLVRLEDGLRQTIAYTKANKLLLRTL